MLVFSKEMVDWVKMFHRDASHTEKLSCEILN
jgi:hypothetical protein